MSGIGAKNGPSTISSLRVFSPNRAAKNGLNLGSSGSYASSNLGGPIWEVKDPREPSVGNKNQDHFYKQPTKVDKTRDNGGSFKQALASRFGLANTAGMSLTAFSNPVIGLMKKSAQPKRIDVNGSKDFNQNHTLDMKSTAQSSFNHLKTEHLRRSSQARKSSQARVEELGGFEVTLQREKEKMLERLKNEQKQTMEQIELDRIKYIRKMRQKEEAENLYSQSFRQTPTVVEAPKEFTQGSPKHYGKSFFERDRSPGSKIAKSRKSILAKSPNNNLIFDYRKPRMGDDGKHRSNLLNYSLVAPQMNTATKKTVEPSNSEPSSNLKGSSKPNYFDVSPMLMSPKPKKLTNQDLHVLERSRRQKYEELKDLEIRRKAIREKTLQSNQEKQIEAQKKKREMNSPCEVPPSQSNLSLSSSLEEIDRAMLEDFMKEDK